MDPEERQRLVGLIQQGLRSDFWAWYAGALQRESKADMISLTDPNVPSTQVEFLRGKLRARNDDLLLPQQALAMYDITDDHVDEVPEEGVPEPRRLSPLPNEGGFDEEW